ncbi:MAG: hypothetical protein V4692_13765, partial [Bdellovibrionota bacterium]
MSSDFSLPEVLRASQALSNEELPNEFASIHLRPGDVPLGFQREAPFQPSTYVTPTTLQDMSGKLERFGRCIQYLFSDGLCLMGHQVLYHPHSKMIPRHLLPLSVNVKADLQDGAYSVDAPVSGTFRPQWQAQTERVIISILMATVRSLKMREQGEDDRAPETLLVCFDPDPSKDRRCTPIKEISLAPQDWGPWRLNAGLADPHSGVHYGRVRLELDPKSMPDLA